MTVTLLRRDCTTVPLSAVREAHAMITDPPYSEHVHANITSAGTMGAGSRGWHRQELSFDPVSAALRAYIGQCAAAVKGWSLVFSDIESSHLWRDAVTLAGAEYIRTIPWVRWSQPQKSGDRPTQGAELVTHAWGPNGTRKAWRGPGSLIAYDAKCLRGADKHRTEKPLDLMLAMVSWFTAPGQTVYDPCAGAGTTGLACRLLGREFVGCELDPVWAERASERLAAPLSDRDRERVERFVQSQRAEAEASLAQRETGHDKKTRARAQARLDDAATVESNYYASR